MTEPGATSRSEPPRLRLADGGPGGPVRPGDAGVVPSLRPLAVALAGREADELLQRAWLRLAEAAPDKALHSGYARRVLVRLWLDRRRSLRREAARLAGIAWSRPATTALAHDAASRRAAVRAAVSRLPARQQAAVVLRLVEELTYAQIAEAIGCSPEAARQSLHAGRSRLRAMLAEVDDD